MRFIALFALVALAAGTVSAGKDFTQCMEKYGTKFTDTYKKDLPKAANTSCLEQFSKSLANVASKVSNGNKATREVDVSFRMLAVFEELNKCLVKKGLDMEAVAAEQIKLVEKFMSDFKKCQSMK